MKCSKCNEENEENFYKSKVKRNYNLCKKCTKRNLYERTKFLKIKAVERLGGKCQKCGYNKNMSALDFHHVREKADKVTRLIHTLSSWKKIKEEVDKCILLCANCHREEHFPNIDKFIFEHSLEGRNGAYKKNIKRIEKIEIKCKTCDLIFKRKPRKDREQKYCSRECQCEGRKKDKR